MVCQKRDNQTGHRWAEKAAYPKWGGTGFASVRTPPVPQTDPVVDSAGMIARYTQPAAMDLSERNGSVAMKGRAMRFEDGWCV